MQGKPELWMPSQVWMEREREREREGEGEGEGGKAGSEDKAT